MIIYPNFELNDMVVYAAFGVSLYFIVSSVVAFWKYIKYGPFGISETLVVIGTQNLVDIEA